MLAISFQLLFDEEKLIVVRKGCAAVAAGQEQTVAEICHCAGSTIVVVSFRWVSFRWVSFEVPWSRRVGFPSFLVNVVSCSAKRGEYSDVMQHQCNQRVFGFVMGLDSKRGQAG